MMKKSVCMLLSVMLLGVFGAGTAVCAEETDNSDKRTYESLGYTVLDPALWEGLEGSLMIYPASSTSVFEDPDIYISYLYYIPVSAEDLKDEENAEAAADKMGVAGMIFSINGDRDQLVETLAEEGFSEKDLSEDNMIKIGEADGYQFYALSVQDDNYAASLDEEYKEEYSALSALVDEELKQAEFFAPIDPMKNLTGKTLSFTATNLDGDTVTSEELFGDNEITMVNMWGVWCINCVNEMEELAEIQERLQEKGCGIVGIEWEEDPSEETYQEARELMEEKGTNYPNVLMPEGNEILDGVGSFPTTIFVDKEGKILCDPIVGARVDAYEPTLEGLLSGTAAPETTTADAGSYIYKVFVTDEENNPLEEVAVQFCDDISCRLGETDEDGCAEFEVPEEKTYSIHIVEAPDGFAYDEEETFNTGETASETTIVLKKNA